MLSVISEKDTPAEKSSLRHDPSDQSHAKTKNKPNANTTNIYLGVHTLTSIINQVAMQGSLHRLYAVDFDRLHFV